MIYDHFKKHNHHKGAVDWNFNVVFDNQKEVMAMADAYQPLLEQAGLYEPIPSKWLHGTILRVGIVDDYSEAEMRLVASELQEQLKNVTLPVFEFSEPIIMNGNVCFKITPQKAFEHLYTTTVSSLKRIVGIERTATAPQGNFIAHTSLVYRQSKYNETELQRILDETAIKPAIFTIKRMPLIKQWPTNGHYEWEVFENIAIG